MISPIRAGYIKQAGWKKVENFLCEQVVIRASRLEKSQKNLSKIHPTCLIQPARIIGSPDYFATYSKISIKSTVLLKKFT